MPFSILIFFLFFFFCTRSLNNLVLILTIIPWARMGSESIAHEAPPSRRRLQVQKPFLTSRSLMIPYIIKSLHALYPYYNARGPFIRNITHWRYLRFLITKAFFFTDVVRAFCNKKKKKKTSWLSIKGIRNEFKKLISWCHTCHESERSWLDESSSIIGFCQNHVLF